MKKYSLAVGAAVAACIISGAAAAAVITLPQSALIPSTDYYTDRIGGGLGTVMVTTGGGNFANVGAPDGRNDDGYRGPIDLTTFAGFSPGFTFFGVNNPQNFYINNNGNVSFGSGIAAFIPDGPQGAPQPIISPFFADVDTRNPASGVVYYRNSAPGEIIITWDQVGYFDQQADKLDSFQLVLRDPVVYNGGVMPVGEEAIGLFWKTMQWEIGDFNTGQIPAAVGFGNGTGDSVVLEGSTTAGIAAIVQNHSLWVTADFTPICGVPGEPPCPAGPVPEIDALSGNGAAAFLAGVLVLASERRRRPRVDT